MKDPRASEALSLTEGKKVGGSNQKPITGLYSLSSTAIVNLFSQYLFAEPYNRDQSPVISFLSFLKQVAQECLTVGSKYKSSRGSTYLFTALTISLGKEFNEPWRVIQESSFDHFASNIDGVLILACLHHGLRLSSLDELPDSIRKTHDEMKIWIVEPSRYLSER